MNESPARMTDDREQDGRMGQLRRFATYLERHSGRKFAFALAVCTVFTSLWTVAKSLIQ